MEEKLKKVLYQINSKIDNFIKELQEKKEILKSTIKSYFSEMNIYGNIDNSNLTPENEIKQKQKYKLFDFITNIENILIEDYKNDFIMSIKQIQELFELIEDNELLYYNKIENCFKNKINDYPLLRMDQKKIITNFGARVTSLYSIQEKGDIYLKLYVGLSNGKINIYDLNNGNILLEIPDVIKNNEILDICSLENGVIACTSGFLKIAIIKIKEHIFINEGITSIKCSYELIQIFEPSKKIWRYTENRIIHIKIDKKNINLDDYKNEYIIQSGWDNLNVYIKKNNGRFYFYKIIQTKSRTLSLFNIESSQLFLANDYFHNSLFVFSSSTLELVTIIKNKGGNNISPFGKLNDNVLAFIGFKKICLYNINNFELIKEIEFKPKFMGINIILAEKNSLMISFLDKDEKEYKIEEYKYLPIEKELKKIKEMNLDRFGSKFFNQCNFYFSNNKKGKRYLIVLSGDDKIALIK